MTEPMKAVFLSYASQDAESARRICDALRAAGIEVWFDQSELRGGDAWDHHIRRQIGDCALFVPIISAHTQARSEGYFRLEWDLADQRSHMIARSKAFLIPVCVDDTPDRGAEVPESFLKVQWTRLPDGSTSTAFVERASRLLSPGPAHAPGDRSPAVAAPHAAAAPRQPASNPAASRPTRRVLLLIVAIVVIGVSYLAADKLILSKRPAASTQTTASTAPASAAAQGTITDKSIAVLPFVDMSEKKDQEYFSDGLSEELIDLLTKVPDLRVPARTSSFVFKGKPEDIATIAQKLRVAHVLEGSVRKAGNTIRVTAQLIRADNGYHLWSETYDRDLKDVFKVQDEIAGAVVTALKLKLAPGQQVPNSRRTSNPEAHNQYLLGRQFFDRDTTDGFRRSIEAYGKAVQLDPSYAAAYAELAISEFVSASGVDVRGFQRALAAAEKAVVLAPNEADGYAVRGFLRSQISWDWSGAQADLEKALALDPGDSRVQRRYAGLLNSLGRLSDAITVAKKATDLDPLSSTEWYYLGAYLIENGQYAAAHAAIRRALEIQPESTRAREGVGVLQLLEGKAAEALATFRQNGEGEEADVAMAEHTLGHAKESRQALDQFITKLALESPYEVAQVYAWRGEKDKAFEWLERAYAQHDSELALIKADPLLKSLRSDPRFNALLRKMKLPE